MGVIYGNPRPDWTTAQVTVSITPIPSGVPDGAPGLVVVTDVPSHPSDASTVAAAAARAAEAQAARGETR